jgi:hypothetical protein
MIGMNTEVQYLFQNNFGIINQDKVYFNEIEEEFSLKKIAYIELKKQQMYFGRTIYYVRVIFTNATSKITGVQKKNLKEVREFINSFSNYRSRFPQLD